MSAVVSMPTVPLQGLTDIRVPLILSVQRDRFHGDFPVRVHVTRSDDARDTTLASATFLGPTP
jgi:hypothetical protein